MVMACETVCNGHHNLERGGVVDNEVDEEVGEEVDVEVGEEVDEEVGEEVDEEMVEEVMGWQPPGSSPVAPS